MSQEIIYTSAAKGLKPGSRGFCTVVSTAGMAKNLADRLEMMSGYRHQYMPHEAGQNPVNFSHLRLTVGGKKYHVLSRVCDAGLDYTKRTNKLAHHVALSTQETTLAAGGPAWAMSQENFLVASWDGEVKTVPESYRKLTSTPCPPRKCAQWAATGVDPGWAGVLAETAEKKAQPMSVIFRDGTDTLALAREAMALISPASRWDVTFSTFFTKLPAGVDCLWRFVLDGTPEASALRRNPHARVIDLCDPALGAAPDGELVELARTGEAAQVAAPQTSTSKPGSLRVIGGDAPPAMAPQDHPLPLDAMETPPHGSTSPSPPTAMGRVRVDPNFASHQHSKSRTIVLVAAMLIFVLVGMIGAYYAGSRSVEVADLSVEEVNRKGADPERKPGAELPEQELAAEKKDNPLDSLSAEARKIVERNKREQHQAEQKKREEEQLDAEVKQAKRDSPAHEPEAVEAEPMKQHKPFDDLETRDYKLQLPQKPGAAVGISAGSPSSEFTKLAMLYVKDLEQCDIVLRGEEIEQRAGRRIKIQRDEKDGVLSWRIIPEFTVSVGLGGSAEAGRFQLVDQTLAFKWGKAPQLDLRLCLLDIKVGDQTKTCTLVRPREVQPIQMRFDGDEQFANLNLGVSDTLKFHVSFAGVGFGDVSVTPGGGLKNGETAVIRIPDPNGFGDRKFVDLEATFERQGLALRAFAYPRFILPEEAKHLVARFGDEKRPVDVTTKQGKHSLSRAILDGWLNDCDKTLKEIEKVQSSHHNLWETLTGDGKRGKKELEAQINEIKARSVPDNEMRKLIQRAQENYAIRQRWRHMEGDRLAAYRDRVSENRRWCQTQIQLLERIHNEGRIHFRAYAELEDRELDLVRSE